MASSEQIQEVQLHETTRTRYLNYAMSVITSRALPDVRDGLKPVQRRILYSMYRNLRLTHDSKPRKSAAIVGDVMGKYHPHGDQSIYDAMVRMAQSFSMRYPLVDGHGNFGSLDGDSAAAMRYTEARLDPLAGELLDEIRRDTVDFRDNYDGTEEEPIVVPAQVPNLLINGATGIAVGMATNIPPHNLVECLDACIALIDDPELTVDDLVPKYVKGPDFPTGGVITNTQKEIKKLYVEGSGTVNIRGEWDIEKDGRKKFVVIHSMPYTVNKSSLVEKIADHIVKGNLPQVTDVRDESTGDVRIILELKRGSDVEAAMAYLFKHTKLESRFHVNMTALTPPKEGGDVPAPATLDLKQVLDHFLDFRMEIVERRLRHELRKLERRIHILEGFEIIFDALDKAIELIRSSEGRAEAREKLMDFFELDEDQANAILEIKLYRLAKMEIEAVREELREKRARAEQIRTLLSDEEARWEVIRKELIALKTAYDDPRRTRIDTDVEDFEYTEADYIVDEDVWVMVSRDGWIKLQKSYSDISKIRVRDNDEIGWVLPGRTPQTVMFFTNRGRAYTMRINDVPTTTGHGDPLQAYFDFGDGEKVVGALTKDDRVLANPSSDQVSLVEDDEETGPQVVAITENGRGVRIAIEDYVDPSTVRGRMFMRLEDDDRVVNVEQFFGLDAEGEDENVALATRDGRGLMFPAREISYYKGIGKGVKAIDLQDDDDVLDWTMARDKYEGLPVETNQGADHEIRASLSKFAPSSRGNKGHWVIKRGHLVRSLRGPHAVPKDRWDDEE